jgi:hypothetical protein
MKKKILISAGVIVAIAGITIGVLALVKYLQPAKVTTDTAQTSKKLVLDHSKDYGACTLLNATKIQTALGDTQLQQPVDAGITSDRYFGDGIKDVTSDTQTCVYAFVPGTSTDETLNGTNGLTIKLTKYTNTDGPKAVIAQMKQNPTATVIDSLGDAAFYTHDTAAAGPDATASFTLVVFKNNASTSYAIIQPATASTFTADSAKTALLSLAK